MGMVMLRRIEWALIDLHRRNPLIAFITAHTYALTGYGCIYRDNTLPSAGSLELDRNVHYMVFSCEHVLGSSAGRSYSL
jgi:hypothetical protein